MKRNCIDEMLLWEYIDDEVDEQTKREIEQHIRACPNCQKQFREFKTLDTNIFRLVQSGNIKRNRFVESSPHPTSAQTVVEVPVNGFWQKGQKRLFFSVFTFLVLASLMGALVFTAAMFPDVAVTPYMNAASLPQVILYKSIDLFLRSSTLIGALFLGLFLYNAIQHKAKSASN